MESSLYHMIRPFILSEVVTSQLFGQPINDFYGVEASLQNQTTSNAKVIKLFGLYGDDWDGKSNELISDDEITKWKNFLVISNEDYGNFFSLSSEERKASWAQFKTQHALGLLEEKIKEGVDHFSRDTYGKRLLLLRRLSKILLDDMFLNYADGRELELLGSLERADFYSDWGQDGLAFNGKPNSYISQREIDKEREFLGITKEEFNRFYALKYGERYLLLESRWYY